MAAVIMGTEGRRLEPGAGALGSGGVVTGPSQAPDKWVKLLWLQHSDWGFPDLSGCVWFWWGVQVSAPGALLHGNREGPVLPHFDLGSHVDTGSEGERGSQGKLWSWMAREIAISRDAIDRDGLHQR